MRIKCETLVSNYIRRIALFVFHFGKLPEQIALDVINESLTTKKPPETAVYDYPNIFKLTEST